MKTNGPVRRAQLISPFGPGSTFVLPDGVSVITCGLDHWYGREAGDLDTREVDLSEFVLREWRLERRLGVRQFRLPPDFRRTTRGGEGTNEELTIPVLRFPQWHVCPACSRLEKVPLNRVEDVWCPTCLEKKGRRVTMAQVRFICMCADGHLQDFPWLEWVHRSPNPRCQGPLRLVSTGSLSVAGQRVECVADGCGAQPRSLSGAVYAETGSGTTNLTEQLYQGGQFLCPGLRPWLGEHSLEGCDEPLHVALRAASNVYFAQVKSAIYLPRERVSEELITILGGVTARTVIGTVLDMGQTPSVGQLRRALAEKLARFSDEEVALGLQAVIPNEEEPESGSETIDAGDEVAFRREELAALSVERDRDELFVRRTDPNELGPGLADIVDCLMLVERLKETRALVGFSRFSSVPGRGLAELKAQLWKRQPDPSTSWLPAYETFGEGILLGFKENLIRDWEARPAVQDWIHLLVERHRRAQDARGLDAVELPPRFVMLHTLAHLVIDRLTFKSGYSSASLRERLYVSDDPADPMAALLIYTAAGDSDGTLGGLVRMGEPAVLGGVIRDALERARWCSADPVCMEIGRNVGQGPDSCNLAACHNCALVPETACENSNRFLDRVLLVGTPESPQLGFLGEIDSELEL